MKSSVVKRSIVIDGHKTSVSLEDPFWTELKNIAHDQQVTLSELVSKIEDRREQSNLSSAIRLFVLHHFQESEWTSRNLRFPPLLLKEHQQASLSGVPRGTEFKLKLRFKSRCNQKRQAATRLATAW